MCFLGFHVVFGLGRVIVQRCDFVLQLNFTMHTQFQVQSSFFLDVVVRPCPVIVNSNCIPNLCMFHIAKTGPLRCCLYMNFCSVHPIASCAKIFEKSIENTCKMFTLGVDFLTASLPRIPGHVVFSLFFGLVVSSTMTRSFLDHVVRDRECIQS